jgi:hypothetical protein
MESVNRAAVLVIPKKPYCEWASNLPDSSLPDDATLTVSHLESTVFLLPEYEDDGEVEGILRGVYSQIFELELAGWDQREDVWPQNRTFEMFLEWFDIIVTSMVLDVSDDLPLMHDVDE